MTWTIEVVYWDVICWTFIFSKYCVLTNFQTDYFWCVQEACSINRQPTKWKAVRAQSTERNSAVFYSLCHNIRWKLCCWFRRFLPQYRNQYRYKGPNTDHLRFCALCLASPQEIPYVRSSVSRYVLLQVVVGRPRLRFPWGFQSSAFLCMLVGSRLRMCPTHHHFRSLMASGIGLCWVLHQSSSLEMLSGHLIWRVCV